MDTGADENTVWFIVSTMGSILSVTTASILIIQFSRNYKAKSPWQSFIFMLVGSLMLLMGAFMNRKFIDYIDDKERYDEFSMLPKMLQNINYVFLLYILYMVVMKLGDLLKFN